MEVIQKQVLQKVLFAHMLVVSVCLLISCTGEITVKQNFDYQIRMQKYRADVKVGIPADFVFFIENQGNYSGVRYQVNCFLRKGTGRLYRDDQTPIVDNTRYEIRGDTLRMNYIPDEKGEHVIEVEFTDNFNQTKEITIKLSAN